MADYLLIHSMGAEQVVETLAIGAALITTFGEEETHVDIATTESLKEYAALSSCVRRVVGVPPLAQSAWDDLKNAASGDNEAKGGGFLSSMTSSVKSLAAAAGKNIKESKAVLEELRVVDYDFVFDFEATAFSIATTKAANAKKTIGFDQRHLINPVPGATLAYHENHFFSGALSHNQLMRKLIERTLDCNLAMPNPPCNAPSGNSVALLPPPAAAPAEPFVYVSRALPTPFVDVIEKHGAPYCLANDGDSAAERLAWVQHASGVIGNETETSLAFFIGKKSLYVGLERMQPAGSILISTPSDLAAALPGFLSVSPPSAAPAAPAAADDTPIKF